MVLEMDPISKLGIVRDGEDMELPPGFRFHPTDEELITHYLAPKVLESNFSARVIGEVDLNKVEPWDLPCKYILNRGLHLLYPEKLEV